MKMSKTDVLPRRLDTNKKLSEMMKSAGEDATGSGRRVAGAQAGGSSGASTVLEINPGQRIRVRPPGRVANKK